MNASQVCVTELQLVLALSKDFERRAKEDAEATRSGAKALSTRCLPGEGAVGTLASKAFKGFQRLSKAFRKSRSELRECLRAGDYKLKMDYKAWHRC